MTSCQKDEDVVPEPQPEPETKPVYLLPKGWLNLCGGRNILLDIRHDPFRQSTRRLLSYRFVLGEGLQTVERQMCRPDRSCRLSMTIASEGAKKVF